MSKKVLIWYLVFLSFLFSVYACEKGEIRDCGFSDIGECSYGKQTCINEEWSICYGAVDPVDEICDDEKDNDCDGDVDEGCECSAGEKKSCNPEGYEELGICKFGVESCFEGEWSGECFDFVGPDVELCGAGEGDGLDNDCDGLVDEDCITPYVGLPSNCFNRLKDEGEEGIDCGGECGECNDCLNGVKEKDEIKVGVDLGGGVISDCGGLNCPACPTCYDNIQNQGEEGVDCGGGCVKSCVVLDEDNDGLVKSVELKMGTDPKNPDSDFDGILDGQDILPLCPNDFCDEFYGENKENCPEDCSEGRGVVWAVLFIFLVLVVAVFLFLYFQFKSSLKRVETKKDVSVKVSRGVDRGSFGGYRRVGSGRKRKKIRESKAERKLRESMEKFRRI